MEKNKEKIQSRNREKQRFLEEDFGISEQDFLKLRDLQVSNFLGPTRGDLSIYGLVKDIRGIADRAKKSHLSRIYQHLYVALQEAEYEQFALESTLGLAVPLKKKEGQAEQKIQQGAFLEKGGRLEKYMTALVSDWWAKRHKLQPKHNYGAILFYHLGYTGDIDHDKESWNGVLREAKKHNVQIDESLLVHNASKLNLDTKYKSFIG
jgi:hypothetical protein